MASFIENLRQANGFGISPFPMQRTFSPGDTWADAISAPTVEAKEVIVNDEGAPLGIQERVKMTEPMREEIKNVSKGRVSVDKSIYNEDSLKNILASILEMYNYENGALLPGYVNVSDPDETFWATNFGPEVSGALFFGGDARGTEDLPYKIVLRDTDYKDSIDNAAKQQIVSGWWTGDRNTMESPTFRHELSHAAQHVADKTTKASNPQMALDYAERVRRQDFRKTHSSPQQLFADAMTNLGYENLRDAVAGVSRYALSTVTDEARAPRYWSTENYLPEVFAEAYTDVLYNKEDAAPYSKELIRLYVNYVNDYQKAFGEGRNKSIDDLKMALGIIPSVIGEESYIDNLRTLGILPGQ